MFRLRIEPDFKKQIETAVKNGKAKNMSDLIRKAVFQFLKESD